MQQYRPARRYDDSYSEIHNHEHRRGRRFGRCVVSNHEEQKISYDIGGVCVGHRQEGPKEGRPHQPANRRGCFIVGSHPPASPSVHLVKTVGACVPADEQSAWCSLRAGSGLRWQSCSPSFPTPSSRRNACDAAAAKPGYRLDSHHAVVTATVCDHLLQIPSCSTLDRESARRSAGFLSLSRQGGRNLRAIAAQAWRNTSYRSPRGGRGLSGAQE